MYEKYSRQALPSKKYRELLGSALSVFNSNNAFVIENILKNDVSDVYNWHSLIDLESGKLKTKVKETIAQNTDKPILDTFQELIDMRNRIVHSFQITDEKGDQVLATKVRNSGKQFIITEKYLLDFINLNEKLSTMLHQIRGY